MSDSVRDLELALGGRASEIAAAAIAAARMRARQKTLDLEARALERRSAYARLMTAVLVDRD